MSKMFVCIFVPDVFVGAILGSAVAYVSYRQYFPPVSSPNCSSSLRSVDMYALLPRTASVPSFRSASPPSRNGFEMTSVTAEKSA